MKRTLSKCFGLTLALTLLAPTVSRAQDALDVLPAKTAVVIRIGSFDSFAGNFDDMMAAISPLATQATAEFRTGLAELIELNSEDHLAGVDLSQPVYVCAFPLDGPTSPIAVVLTPADRDVLGNGLSRAEAGAVLEVSERPDGFMEVAGGERPIYFKEVGNRVLYTLREDILAQLVDAEDDPFASVLSDSAKTEFMEGDAAIAVNSAYLTELFSAQIEFFRNEVMTGIDSLPDEALQGAGIPPEDVKQVYKELANVGFTLVLDTESFVGRISFGSQGAHGGGLLTVKGDSATDQFIAANPPRELETLGLLPAEAPAYYGIALDEDTFGEMTASYLQMQLAGTDQASVASAVKAMQESGLQSMVGSFALPRDDTTGIVAGSITTARDAEAMRKASGQMIGAYAGMDTPLMSITMLFEENAETYKDIAIDLVRQQFILDETSQEGAILSGFFNRMFGGSELQTRVAVQENLVVSSSGNGPQPMRRLLDGLATGDGVLGVTDAFGEARDKLSPQANLVFMMDVPRLIVDGVNMIKDIPPFDMIFNLAGGAYNFAYDPPASYAAGSIATEDHALRLRGFLSVEQPKGIFRIFFPGVIQ